MGGWGNKRETEREGLPLWYRHSERAENKGRIKKNGTLASPQARGNAREIEACHTLTIIKAKTKYKFGSIYD